MVKTSTALSVLLAALAGCGVTRYYSMESRAGHAPPTGMVDASAKAGSEYRSGGEGSNTESYSLIVENPFLDSRQNPLSTFALDVDSASYANARRFLMSGRKPPVDAVRIEEFINYFQYETRAPAPGAEHPFNVEVETAACPWAPRHRLVRIGMKGRELEREARPASNLVFLLDVSGSMGSYDKLPLLVQSLRMTVNNLNERDRVAIVVYAGAAGLVLPSTSCERKDIVIDALESLQAGGSTNGGQGIQLAYRVARENFIPGGNNRVILATDGDFNVGVSSDGALIRLIEEEAKSSVFLTVLGFGTGNIKDSKMEQLADRGNGNYAYIDSLYEAKKVLVEEMGGSLFAIAKDVKLQIEFNPLQVGSYRLIGYENRLLRDEDFNDDQKDGGELGAGHSVTALYEISPVASNEAVDPLRYQQPGAITREALGRELLTVKLRYKRPESSQSILMVIHADDDGPDSWEESSKDFRFAAAVASFGMLLRDSKHSGSSTYASVLELAESAIGEDPHGYRRQFCELVRRAWQL